MLANSEVKIDDLTNPQDLEDELSKPVGFDKLKEVTFNDLNMMRKSKGKGEF